MVYGKKRKEYKRIEILRLYLWINNIVVNINVHFKSSNPFRHKQWSNETSTEPHSVLLRAAIDPYQSRVCSLLFLMNTVRLILIANKYRLIATVHKTRPLMFLFLYLWYTDHKVLKGAIWCMHHYSYIILLHPPTKLNSPSPGILFKVILLSCQPSTKKHILLMSIRSIIIMHIHIYLNNEGPTWN